MTTATVDQPVSPESTAFRACLARYRRRASVTLFGSFLCLASALSLFIAVGVILTGLEDAVSSIVGAAAAAVLLALVAAIVRKPSIRATAAAIDNHLHLQDRVVTAFQFQAAEDAFSKLVVRDAAERLSALSPADAFPFKVPYAALAIAVAGAMLAIVFTIVVTGVTNWRPIGNPGASIAGAVASAWQRARQAPLAAAPSATTALIAGPSADLRRDQPRASASAAQTNGPQDPGFDEPRVGAAAADGGKPGSSETVAGSLGGSGEGSAGRGAAAAGSSVSNPTATAHAGGVQDAAAVASRSSGARAPVSDRAYAAAYRAARAGAEAAIARERIPSDRRAYVRQYFVAIRPQAQR